MSNRYQQQHYDPLDSEEEEDLAYADEKVAPSGVNHHGKSALYTVAYFAFLAVLMYPAQKMHLGMQGIFFAMIAAGLLLALFILLLTWVRRQMASWHLSKKEVVQVMVGYAPDGEVAPREEGMDTSRTATLFSRTSTSLVPYSNQRGVIGYGEEDEEGGYDEEDDLPDAILEENPLSLSERFQPNANSMLGTTVLLCGMRRSGKSNGVAVIAEELARYYCPLCIGDTEDEYGPLSSRRYLPRGVWAGSAALSAEMARNGVRRYLAIDRNGAYEFGQAIVRDVLQVVLHLKSFESEDDAACVMAEIICGMHDWEANRPNSRRVPCTFILDEASKWIPQRLEESCLTDKEMLVALQQALFGTMVRRGGKQGLGLVLATQRIAELDKRALQSQWKLLFRQTEAVDLALYGRLGLAREQVVSLSQGECFIFSPTVIGFRTMLRQRTSPHLAHTPGLPHLAQHLRTVRPIEVVTTRSYTSVDTSLADYQDNDDLDDGNETQSTTVSSAQAVRTSENSHPRPLTLEERALKAWQEGHQSGRKLAAALDISEGAGNQLMNKLAAKGMVVLKQRKQEPASE